MAFWEKRVFLCILAVSLAVQANALLHHGYMGQDYQAHSEGLALAIDSPNWWIHRATNPPLLYWLGALLHHITLSTAYEGLLGLCLVVLNLGALYAWFALIQRVIASPLIRIAALITVTFLPFRLIHSAVLAGDGLSVLPFSLVILLFSKLLRAGSKQRERLFVLLLSVALGLGILTKYTMVSALPVAALLLVYFKSSFTNFRIWLFAFAFVVIMPAGVALMEFHEFSTATLHTHARPSSGRDMLWRSLLFPRLVDLELLEAPPFNATTLINGESTYQLLISNKFSYPGLLHLSMYTDVLNVFQYDPTDSYFGRRGPQSQWRMAIAVKLGLITSLLALTAVIGYSLRFARVLLRDRLKAYFGSHREQAVILAFSLAWFCNIALVLPYVNNAYHEGYWLSRLVMQPLMGFVVLGFVVLGEVVKSRVVQLSLLGFAVAQALLHLSFLWPRGA